MKTAIEGRGALVTGASRGLGKEVARALARRGARVVMVAREEGPLRDAAHELSHEGEVHALAFDVGDKLAIHRIAGAAAALVGPIDVLVHAAGSLGPVPLRPLLDTDCEDLERALAVNLLGPFRLTRAVAGSMVLRQTGAVVFVSTDAAVEAYPTWGAYGVSKAAQDHLGRVFAAELDGPRILVVDPGEMDTKMHADALPDADRAALARPEAVAEHVARLVTGVFEGRVASGRLTSSELQAVSA